jgi:predicted nucleotidyltransferase
MAEAAARLQTAFQGLYYAWFGGWALRLRGSRRESSDLDLLVLADNVGQVRAKLAPFNWFVSSLQRELSIS